MNRKKADKLNGQWLCIGWFTLTWLLLNIYSLSLPIGGQCCRVECFCCAYIRRQGHRRDHRALWTRKPFGLNVILLAWLKERLTYITALLHNAPIPWKCELEAEKLNVNILIDSIWFRIMYIMARFHHGVRVGRERYCSGRLCAAFPPRTVPLWWAGFKPDGASRRGGYISIVIS